METSEEKKMDRSAMGFAYAIMAMIVVGFIVYAFATDNSYLKIAVPAAAVILFLVNGVAAKLGKK